MTFARRNASGWLDDIRAISRRYQDPGLSALLAAQLILAFVAEPLAFEGVELPLIVIGTILAGLILLLALGSNQRGALIVAGAAGAARLLALGADLLWSAPVIEAADATSVLAPTPSSILSEGRMSGRLKPDSVSATRAA